MAWQLIDKLYEGQYIQIREKLRKSFVSSEISSVNPLYPLKYSTLRSYSRNDIILKIGSIGKVIGPKNSYDGTYLFKFGFDPIDEGPKLKPNKSFTGHGYTCRLPVQDLKNIAMVWVD